MTSASSAPSKARNRRLAASGGCSDIGSALERSQPAADPAGHLTQRLVGVGERALAGGLQRVEPFAFAAALGCRVTEA